MQSAARFDWKSRGVAALALLVPCGAGLVYLALFGAPSSYLYVNAGALAAGVLWALFGKLPSNEKSSRILMFALVAALGLPLLTGPEVFGIARWVPLGGINLYVGMTVIPLLAALSARDVKYGHIAQLSAMLLALFQPDPASALAITIAALGAAVVQNHPNWGAYILFALLTLGATVFLANLPPQEFVERVIFDLFGQSPLAAILLSLSLVTSIALILGAPGADKAARVALAGTLFGFTLASLIGDYPTPLIGYGAATVIGFGLALPALRKRN